MRITQHHIEIGSVCPITDLRKDGPLGWRCDYVTPINLDVFTHTFEAQTPDRLV